MTIPVVVQPEPLEAAVEVEARRRRADEQQSGARVGRAEPRERLEQLRHALALVDVPERPDQRVSVDRGRGRVWIGPGGVRDDGDRPRVADRADALLDVVRVDDEPGREREHLSGEREVLGPRLPQRRDPLVEHPVGEEPSDDAVLPLHRVEVPVAVPPRDGRARDEVVKDEVV